MRRQINACWAIPALLLALSGFRAFAQDSAVRPAAGDRGDLARFRERAEAVLVAGGAEKAYWGGLIVDAETGEILYSLNANRYFKPASNVKLFT
jgi:D-alanyl-D-alanine carboxypeptidase